MKLEQESNSVDAETNRKKINCNFIYLIFLHFFSFSIVEAFQNICGEVNIRMYFELLYHINNG